MYVLKDAENPQNVHLPVDPTISPMVSLWKGITKPFASFALGADRARRLPALHHRGPKEEPIEEDDMDPTKPDDSEPAEDTYRERVDRGGGCIEERL